MRIANLVTIGGMAALALQASAQEAVPNPEADKGYPTRRLNQPAASGASATFTVRPGQTLQSAVDRLQPGDKIEIMPGTYHESVMIDLDNIEVKGIIVNGERPLLDGKGEMNDAMLVSGNNFTVSGLEIRNYKGNGIVVNQAENCAFRDLVAENTGKYALYPLQCKGVLVEDCVASGVWDAAIYAGQCQDVILRNNTVYHNTIGLETENSVNVQIYNNTAFDNSLGILCVLLPNLPAKKHENARVFNNRCLNNNYPNYAPKGTIVHSVVPGMGITITACDNTEVTRNLIEGHNSFGIGVASLTALFPDTSKLDVEPEPDNTFVHNNVFVKNGEDPAKVAEKFTKVGAKGGDLFWSGTGTGNLWNEKTTRSFPESLPSGQPAGFAGGAQ